ASRVLLDVTTVLLAQPPDAADRSVEFRRVLAAAQGDHVGVMARCSDNLQHFVDRGVRMAASVVLVSGQSLERYCRLERIVVEDCSRSIVNSGMHCQDELTHR